MENAVTINKNEYVALIKAQFALDLIRKALSTFKYDSDMILAIKVVLGIKEENPDA